MMSKQTYETVARVLYACDLSDEDVLRLAQQFAFEFQNDNGRFDRAKFFSACGLDDYTNTTED